MTRNSDLQRIEGRLFSSYFRDGALDVMVGILILTMAFRTMIDHWTVSLLALGGVLYVLIIRTFVTRRRMGVARFSSGRKKKRARMLLVILIANLITLILLVATLLGAHPSVALSAAVITTLVVLSFSVVAYLMNYWRFFIWGALLAGTILVYELVGGGPAIIVSLVIGTAITFVGLGYLISFLGKYPSRRGG
ncbi:MAG: hypothetical protein ACMUHM_02325 [Thermoplasmatota archaeon]